MVTFVYDKGINTIDSFKAECREYIEECRRNGENVRDYERDMESDDILHTGLFHDAVGKIVSEEENGIVITTEY